MAARKRKKTARNGNRTAGGRDENRTKEYAGKRPDIPHLGKEQSDKKEDGRKRIFEIIQIGQTEDLPSRLFDLFLVLAIVLNISALILETFSELEPYMPVFKGIEVVTVVIFTIEYALRIWTADPAVWNRHAPILFPFVGKVTEARFCGGAPFFGR